MNVRELLLALLEFPPEVEVTISLDKLPDNVWHDWRDPAPQLAESEDDGHYVIL